MHWGSSIIISTCQKNAHSFYPDSSSLVCFILAYLLDEVKLIQNGCEFWDTDSLMGLSCSLTYFCIVWRCVTVKRKGMTSNMMCCYRKCEQAPESSKTESNQAMLCLYFLQSAILDHMAHSWCRYCHPTIDLLFQHVIKGS